MGNCKPNVSNKDLLDRKILLKEKDTHDLSYFTYLKDIKLIYVP
jgi:hypothetical protein